MAQRSDSSLFCIYPYLILFIFVIALMLYKDIDLLALPYP